MDDITLDIHKTVFEPQDEVVGRVTWSLHRSPKVVTVTAGWYTQGRGSEDEQIEIEQKWRTDENRGVQGFVLPLSKSPYSYSGKLIEIIWYVSAKTKKGGLHTRTDIVVSPNGKPVTLS